MTYRTNPVKATALTLVAVVLFVTLSILIRKAEQQAQIVHAQNGAVRAKAEQRVIEAEGIRKAQDLISKTLTPLYVQHEAIKAQMDDRQGDRTYIPVGPQGVPLVANVNGDRVAGP